MNKEELIAIFEDTKTRCSDIPSPISDKHNTKEGLVYFSEKLAGEIVVEPLDTVSALTKYVNEGKTAVLNMASNKRKGGGVSKGASAQEESLFRCSNLFTIPDEFYPLEVDEFIYTKQATFIKNVDYSIIYPMDADVITVAAPNLNKENKHFNLNDISEGYEQIVNKKINAMLDCAASNNCKNIILGAWGCGVFKNEPAVMAKLFNNSLKTKRYFFDKVVFAVINDHNSVANNYEIFKNIIKTHE